MDLVPIKADGNNLSSKSSFFFQAAVRLDIAVEIDGLEMKRFHDYIVFEYYTKIRDRGWRIQDRVFESDRYYRIQ